MRAVAFPNGQRVILDNCIGYQAEGGAVKFTSTAGGVLGYTANNQGSAAAMSPQIDSAVQGSDNTVTNIVESPTITSISPSSFDISAGGGANLTINGFGFSADTIGNLWFEDTAGGKDSNGYHFVCTYVSPTQITAVYGSSGDGALSLGMLVYYQDSNNVQSNALNAVNTSGTLITVIE
jgi:IPT/TIG domain